MGKPSTPLAYACVKFSVQAAINQLAGTYVIVNLVNGKMYVGSGITGRTGIRFHKHLFTGQGSRLVWAAVQKYGLCNFAFVVAGISATVVTAEDNQALLDMETGFITSLAPAYNIAQQAGNTYP